MSFRRGASCCYGCSGIAIQECECLFVMDMNECRWNEGRFVG